MSFSRGSSFGSSTPQSKPGNPSLYPSLGAQTPATPSPPFQHLQNNPPQRPASVPLSFGGGLPHSASTPSLSQQFQTQDPLSLQNPTSLNPQQPQTFSGQPFSPAPQPPMTTYDLGGGASLFNKPAHQQWGQPLGGHGLTRSHSQQFMPQGMGNPLAERRYLPSHLRSYSPERSSPLAKESVTRDAMPSPKEKRRVSFGSVSTFGNPSTANFGGAGFGTPKDDQKGKQKREEEDLPPSASIYDFSRSSPFAKQDQQATSPPPDITPSLFGSVPPPSPPKRQDPTPVIIFGFPPSHAPLIIREYEKYGPILEHFSSTQSTSGLPLLHPAPSQEIVQGGNWLRVTYADPVSAARAVATNGQTIGGAYMIGVVYAPKAQNQEQQAAPSGSEKDEHREETSGSGPERPSRSAGGERKMNVVRGGQSMFVKKEQPKIGSQVGWGQWIWDNVVGGVSAAVSGGPENRKEEGQNVNAGSTQSNAVVRALKGLSETVFGF